MSSRSINKITLLGNLTRDPELKYTPNGTAVCTFSLATNRSWTTKEGKVVDEVQYHRVVAWQKLAELCSKLLSKGKKAYLEGRITYRDYIDKDGAQKHITEVVLEDFIAFYDGTKKPSDRTEKPEQSKNDNDLPDQEDQKTSTEPKKDHDEDINPDDIPF
ncbi:single-stranded DNA-binding protein [Candidatus Roizmanbacteria bacterium CG11_big_fil_rev_8_21_14_0_20_36_8]|uniref:Single-stranded DNA-binding protein n=2 Tax=Candidatus Roizmaniibacteriota TaxID=1752723 RepID=A0A2M6IV27_9BACT|nr:MAG: single-stranded DNA-binding protein [Candidatus Roizmanbacteria bacterium CG11_big_fil_rev_8_21_14_0_20_36_8]PIZ65907.1 MAG: single-stranded DNA-binding protein [Candidatus Roizmanbacteria bacterium CG_4_10_14_0_2_um_filter_36_9]